MVERFTTLGLVIQTFCVQVFHLATTCPWIWEQITSVDGGLMTANDNQTFPTNSYSYDPPPPPFL